MKVVKQIAGHFIYRIVVILFHKYITNKFGTNEVLERLSLN